MTGKIVEGLQRRLAVSRITSQSANAKSLNVVNQLCFAVYELKERRHGLYTP